MAAFTTANARHRVNHRPSKHVREVNTLCDFDKSASLESVDSGHFSSVSSQDELNLQANSRCSQIKRVIISEKITPYQLKIQQSKGIRLMRRPAVSTDNSNSNLSSPQKSGQVESEANEELTEEDIEFLIANTGFNNEQIKSWSGEFMRNCANGRIAYDQFKVSFL